MKQDDRTEKLNASAPLPPLCEQYLDFDAIGSDEAKDAVIEHFMEVYVNNPRIDPKDHTLKEDPFESACEHVSSFDDVTINLMSTAFNTGLVKFSVFAKMRANDMRGIEARNYFLLQIAIRDLEAKSGSFRQFQGLHVLQNMESGVESPLTLSTDEQYRGNVACLRYGVKVTNALPMREGEALFLTTNREDLIVHPKMYKLLRSRPDDADRIADIVIERRTQEPEIILQMLDGTIAPSLGSGVI